MARSLSNGRKLAIAIAVGAALAGAGVAGGTAAMAAPAPSSSHTSNDVHTASVKPASGGVPQGGSEVGTETAGAVPAPSGGVKGLGRLDLPVTPVPLDIAKDAVPIGQPVK